MTADELVAGMRALGVRSIELEPSGIQSGESQPQASQGPDALETDLPPEQKAANACCMQGCTRPNGFYFAPQFCQQCGLAAFHVRASA